ncbi:MAG TPA: cupin domain-containing protein [Candidatus Binatia bacterium]|nr:cupin domain-containing protein [Candidatus Binatia bacterium]
MAKHKHVIHLSGVPVDKINAPEGSVFGGKRRRVGAYVGAQKLGYSFFSVPPGKTAFPYHNHTGNEEMIYILAGKAVLRLGKDELKVSADTVVACPPGDFPHQLINTGSGELRYLVVSTMAYPDISEYPDSNKIGAYATSAGRPQTGFRALYVRDRNVTYYDGEDGAQVERVLKSARGGAKDTPAT